MAFSNVTWDVGTGGSDSNGGGFAGGSETGAPSAPSVSTATSGGSVAANTYYVIITLTDEYGQSPKSSQTSIVTTGATSTITVTAPTVDRTVYSHWSVYMGTVTGGPYFLQGSQFQVPGTNFVRTTTPATTGTQPPGTDFSRQDAAQHSYTDLVIDAVTNTSITSAGRAFTPVDVGNVLNVTSGTGFTVQRLQITAVSAAGVATVDKSAGTLGSTGGNATYGGRFLTPGFAAGAMTGTLPSCRIHAGNYDCSSTANVAAGRMNPSGNGSAAKPARIYGAIGEAKPALRPSANSVSIIAFPGSLQSAEGITFNPNGFTGSIGVNGGAGSSNRVRNCKFTTATGATIGGASGNVFDSEFDGCDVPVSLNSTGCRATGNRIINCAGASAVVVNSGGCIVSQNLIHSCTGGGINTNASSTSALVIGNTLHFTGGTGTPITVSGPHSVVENNVISNVDQPAFTAVADGNATQPIIRSNAVYRSDGGAVFSQLLMDGGGNVTLTADPFVSVAGLNFALNNVAGGGAAARGIAWPTTWPGLATTVNDQDAGAVQSGGITGPSGGLLYFAGLD